MRTITSILFLAACGTHAGPAPAPHPSDLAGHWVSDCTPSPQADGSTKYVTLDFHNTSARWQLAYALFGDRACTARLVTVGIAGSYELGGAASVPGAREAVFRFDRKTITPAIQPLADALNGMPGCGGGFAVGAARDVYEHGCPGFGQYPRAACQADYDLVSRHDGELRFGKRPADNNMCSADRRPTELSDLVLHLR
ncbi:MAG: hypothetical protein ACM31C_14455 [Acidobacteriota bacterium]